jgi:uncharacterized protein (DUF2249 family)
MVIRAGDRVARVLERDQDLRTTDDAHTGKERKEMAAVEGELPPTLAGIAPERVIDLDVRDDLRSGREPFSRIMAARQALAEGHVLRLRTIFEPVPLYQVMRKQGFARWTEQLAADDWRVWFYRDEAIGPAQPSTVRATPDTDQADENTTVLDVRGMEPPEPMVRTLAALERLPDGATLVQVNVRVPQFLLPRLDELGYEYEVREQNDELVRVFIRRRASRGAAFSPEPPGAALPDRRDRMEDTAGQPMQLDVRVIPPREKHPTIFRTFDALEPGQAFVLVNDHDPLPLRYQFEAERAGQYRWEYLEQGPTVWRVELGKR